MFDYKKDYSAPDFLIDETRKIIYDSNGDARSIVNITNTKNKIKIKSIYKNILFWFLVLLILYGAYCLSFKFTPKKWANEKWRPIIIWDLRIRTNVNFYQDSVSEMIANFNTQDPRMVEGGELFTGFEKRNNKYNLYFKTPEQIEKMLGEENPKGYNIPQLPENDGRFIICKAYYCYGEEDQARWIIVTYDKNYAVNINFVKSNTTE